MEVALSSSKWEYKQGKEHVNVKINGVSSWSTLLVVLCGDKYIDIPPVNNSTAPEMRNMPPMDTTMYG